MKKEILIADNIDNIFIERITRFFDYLFISW